MTIIPKKAQVVILTSFVLFIAWMLLNWLRLSYELSDIREIDAINRIYVEKNGTEIEIPKESWSLIIASITDTKKRILSGYKGESWTFYCDLVIVTNSDYDYIFQFAQRPSHGEMVSVQYLRGSVSSHWSYNYYDGTKLMKIINEVVALSIAKQQNKTSMPLQFCR
ncbi:hypothetical protein [Shewanella sedimentimangrovi]|uniref:Uncharacterized protein n=1 Tax=Shewanella sedimentimangrovi TaxID=2814293 RepID=A0ABX7QYE5_9GAMM|nr:hypothetical protein [Shewanella sedimentimangrovi]QSX36541.1 hypothetical protein JYB85_14815 [Shewanella sedimentimangrovi]